MDVELIKTRARNRAHEQLVHEHEHGHTLGDGGGEEGSQQDRFQSQLAGFRQTTNLAGRHADASSALKEVTVHCRKRAATNIQRYVAHLLCVCV